MAIGWLGLALLDVLLTSIGVLYFEANEANLLLVELSRWLPWGADNQKIVLAVWLSKMTVIAIVLLVVHAVVKSEPARDDKAMFCGLLVSLVVYVGVIASWALWFCVERS